LSNVHCETVRSTAFRSARFPHSEIPGSKVASHLPEAYRRHATSFIASTSQGIHHPPIKIFTCPRRKNLTCEMLCQIFSTGFALSNFAIQNGEENCVLFFTSSRFAGLVFESFAIESII